MLNENLHNLEDKRLSLNAYEYYNNNQYDVRIEGASGSLFDCKNNHFQFPQMVVKQWISTVLAEEPTVTLSKDKDAKEIDMELDLKMVLHDLLAYGEVFIVPELVKGNIRYTLVNRWASNVKMVEEDGLMVYFQYEYTKREYTKREYNKATKRWRNNKYVCKHTYDEETRMYTDEKYLEDMLISSVEYKNMDGMLPYKVSNRTLNTIGKPVYYDAINVINELDDTMNDNISDRELSKALMLLPEYMVKSELEIEDDGTPKVNDKYLGAKRYFRIMPSNEDSTIPPIKWSGDWTPTNYIEHINFLLHLLSVQTGFGAKYFTYDAVGGFKTATEIVSEKTDMYKNKLMYDQILEEVIEQSLLAENILMNSSREMPTIKIVFSDSLVTDDEKKQELVFRDFQNGAIDQITYLELAGYTQDEISKIMERTGSTMNGDVVDPNLIDELTS